MPEGPRRRAARKASAPMIHHSGEMIGVTYQQAHKYERGINRVSAGRLFEIARALSAPIIYFYEGVGEEAPRQITPHQRMRLEIARNFAEIRNERHQEAMSQLARALASR
jgi:transcriptional regulator with XRE-family HTH domain